MKDSNYLIYGAYGYTGELISRLAKERGQEPILGGRNKEKVEKLAKDLGLEARVFSLADKESTHKALDDCSAVIHCAGPFVHTFKDMADACLASKTHYMDVTGEISVFEALASRDEEAKQAGVMLMPGVGFDVVPSDCLALHLKNRLPSATELTLGFQGTGKSSRGTLNTIVENIDAGGAVRRKGVIEAVPAAHMTRVIDFGRGASKAITIPWGDVSTAYYSTGIPNITVFTAVPLLGRAFVKASRFLEPILGSRTVKGFLQARIQAGAAGPNEEERARARSFLWGEAKDEDGGIVVSRLKTPEGYTLTAATALEILGRVLQGDAPVGFQTPAKAYGADLILAIESVTRSDD